MPGPSSIHRDPFTKGFESTNSGSEQVGRGKSGAEPARAVMVRAGLVSIVRDVLSQYRARGFCDDGQQGKAEEVNECCLFRDRVEVGDRDDGKEEGQARATFLEHCNL